MNGNGTNKDEYVTKPEQKASYKIALSTDQSRQLQAGWYFIHGDEGLKPSEDWHQVTRIHNSWKNTLYGDGHAVSVKPDKVIWRWGLLNPAGW